MIGIDKNKYILCCEAKRLPVELMKKERVYNERKEESAGQWEMNM